MDKRYREFYENLAQRYKESRYVYSTPSGRLRQRFIRDWLKKANGSVLIDVGSGDCSNIAGYSGQCVAVDIAFRNLVAAKNNLKNALFVQGDIEDMGFLRENSFEIGIMNEVIEHLQNPLDALKHLYNAIKPGGKVLITCPNWTRKRPTKERSPIIEMSGVKYPENDGYIHTAYRPEELKEMVESVGFKAIEWGSFEKELRLWTRILNLILSPFDPLVRKSRRIYNIRMMIDNLVYRILSITGITFLVSKVVRDGRRTYVIAEKPR